MKSFKWATLMMSSGTLLALGGCATIVKDLATQAVMSQVLQAVIGVFTTPLREAMDAAAGATG